MGEGWAEDRPAWGPGLLPNTRRMLRLIPVWLCLVVAGCASAVEGPLIFTDAGKYQYHNCDQLAAAAKTQATREQELKALIDRAEEGVGGVLVSLMAYKADYIAVEEELRVIETTARSKHCLTPATWQSNAVIQ
jgi:hypothetical protein